jgi:DNA-binding beta-propeller fold protein YncE
MYRFAALMVLTIGFVVASGSAQQPVSGGPYRVLKTAKVGGEGGWDYLYADAAGRRLYIPRRGGAGPANGASPAAAIPTRLTIFNLDTLEPVGQIDGVGGNGTAVDPKSGHGFTSSKPVSMFDTKTMKLIKTIDVGNAAPDGIVFDDFNERVYVLSHPTMNATVIDAKDGTLLGTIDLGGTPEEGVADGKGMLYVVMQDMPGSVTAVDVKTMKAVGHYSFNGIGACNGLALDTKNRVLFAACRSDTPPVGPAATEDGHPERGRRENHHDSAACRRLRRGDLQPGHDGSLQHAWQRYADHNQGE